MSSALAPPADYERPTPGWLSKALSAESDRGGVRSMGASAVLAASALDASGEPSVSTPRLARLPAGPACWVRRRVWKHAIYFYTAQKYSSYSRRTAVGQIYSCGGAS